MCGLDQWEWTTLPGWPSWTSGGPGRSGRRWTGSLPVITYSQQSMWDLAQIYTINLWLTQLYRILSKQKINRENQIQNINGKYLTISPPVKMELINNLWRLLASPRKVIPNAFAWQAEEEKVHPGIICYQTRPLVHCSVQLTLMEWVVGENRISKDWDNQLRYRQIYQKVVEGSPQLKPMKVIKIENKLKLR